MSRIESEIPEAIIEFRMHLSGNPQACAAVRHIVQTAMGTGASGADIIDGSPDPKDRVLLLAAMHDWYYRRERLHGRTGWLIIESSPTDKDTEQLPPVTCDSVSFGRLRTAVFFLAFQQRVESHIEQYGRKSCVDLCLHGDTVAALLEKVAPHSNLAAAQADGGTPANNQEGGKQAAPGEADQRGYVEWPVDPAAYRPASEVVTHHTPAGEQLSMGQLQAICEDYRTNHVRWTRPRGRNGQPMKNRRSVHIGDWVEHLKKRTFTDAEGFPRQSEDEIQRRAAAVRRANSARK